MVYQQKVTYLVRRINMFSIKLDENCDIAFDKSGIAELVTSEDDVVKAIRVEL